MALRPIVLGHLLNMLLLTTIGTTIGWLPIHTIAIQYPQIALWITQKIKMLNSSIYLTHTLIRKWCMISCQRVHYGWKKIFALMMDKPLTWAPKVMRQLPTTLIWIWVPFFHNIIQILNNVMWDSQHSTNYSHTQ